jgi:hypothetical protein
LKESQEEVSRLLKEADAAIGDADAALAKFDDTLDDNKDVNADFKIKRSYDVLKRKKPDFTTRM